MSAKLQLEKEIRQAVVFLREHNQTIPSDTIEFMKVASLEKLESLEEPRIMVLGNPETVEKFMQTFNKAVYSTGIKNAKGDLISIGDSHICTDGLHIGKANRLVIVGKATPEQRESFWGQIKADYIDDQNQMCIDDDNEEGQVIAKVNMRTGEVQYIDVRAKTDNYAQEVIAEVLEDIVKEVLDINNIKAIIERKKLGQDCTEEESAEIKGYLREEKPLVADIQYWFPQEYGEYFDEKERE